MPFAIQQYLDLAHTELEPHLKAIEEFLYRYPGVYGIKITSKESEGNSKIITLISVDADQVIKLKHKKDRANHA